MQASEIINRTLSEVLYPAGVNEPAQDSLVDAIDDSQLTLTLAGKITSVPAHSRLEIDEELVTVDSKEGVDITLLERAYLETFAAEHDAGAVVRLNPEFPRRTIFNALKTVVGMLYPWGVYRRRFESSETYRTDSVIQLPSTARKVLSVRARRTATRWGRSPLKEGIDYEVFYDGEETDFYDSGFEDTFQDAYGNVFQGQGPEIQLYRGGFTGGGLRIVYAEEFTRPVESTESLTTLGVPITIQEGLPLAIAGHLLQGREMSRLNIEEIRRLLIAAGANIPVGATFNVARAFLDAFKQVYVAAEKNRLLEVDPTRFVYVG